MESERTGLRKQLRVRRRALSPEAQQKASGALLEIVRRENIIGDSRHVALYLANDGEIDPSVIVKWLWQEGIKCYLPVLDSQRERQLLFVAYDSKTHMTLNRFGINEPIVNELIISETEVLEPQVLDLVFMPMTGFSADGLRMGMGGGFYDRTFAFTKNSTKPKLIGLAHECQKVPDTYSSNWDIPTHGVVTDQQFYRSNGVT